MASQPGGDSALDSPVHELHDTSDLEDIVWQARPVYDLQLGEVLIQEGIITETDLDQALLEQGRRPGTQLGRILVSLGLANQYDIHMALARKLGIPRVSIKHLVPKPEVMAQISADIALLYNVMPLGIVNDRLIVAMENPLDWHTLEVLQFHTNRRIEPVVASHAELNKALGTYYGKLDEAQILEEINEDAIIETVETSPDNKPLGTIEQEASKKPIVRLLNAIILQGVLRGASDIHVRPGKDQADILYRVDGVLQFSRTVQKTLLAPLIARIKIIGNMNIAERRRPQDGHARFIHQGNTIDFRISIMPSTKGESAVVRILDKEVGLRSMEELGFIEENLESLRMILTHTHGMLLVTGPTGSGKSTTLYAVLNELRRLGPHIITVEDPVEYDMDGVEQMQISNVIGYTFAEALRHILRHDPDVIMVGEIRDLETARIAVKAALTGHLVLSTLHTNDAASAVTRLTEMGVESYLVSSTVLGVLAQRLVRKICPECKEVDTTIHDDVRRILKVKKNEQFYIGKGCASCNNTGYQGRTTVVELLVMSPELVDLVNKEMPEERLREAAIHNGMQTLTQNAVELARRGITSLSEVFAVRLE